MTSAFLEDRYARAFAAVAAVVDPELPVLTIADLGILRDVRFDGEVVDVVITPTYSGCPAISVIALDVELALVKAGFPKARVSTVLSPSWTTEWMTEDGRAKLRAYGVAPPVAGSSCSNLFGVPCVACPQCGSESTERISEFGSTSCKALWRCHICAEPFEYFKCH